MRKTRVTYPRGGDNPSKEGLIPDVATGVHTLVIKSGNWLWEGLAAYQLVGGVTAYQGEDA